MKQMNTYNGMDRIPSSQSEYISTRDNTRAFFFNKALYCVNEFIASKCKIWNSILFSLIGLC